VPRLVRRQRNVFEAQPLGSTGPAPFALHQFAQLAFFPSGTEQCLSPVDAEGVEREPETPTARWPDEPPRPPCEKIDQEQSDHRMQYTLA